MHFKLRDELTSPAGLKLHIEKELILIKFVAEFAKQILECMDAANLKISAPRDFPDVTTG